MKQAAILQAEGVRQSEILKAEGDAQARITRATAEAKAIEMVSNAAETFFKERAEVSKRLDVLNTVLAQQTKFIVPTRLGPGERARSRRQERGAGQAVAANAGRKNEADHANAVRPGVHRPRASMLASREAADPVGRSCATQGLGHGWVIPRQPDRGACPSRVSRVEIGGRKTRFGSEGRP